MPQPKHSTEIVALSWNITLFANQDTGMATRGKQETATIHGGPVRVIYRDDLIARKARRASFRLGRRATNLHLMCPILTYPALFFGGLVNIQCHQNEILRDLIVDV